MLKGVNVTLLMGPVVPVPVPQAVLDALAHLRRNAPQLDAAGWDQDLIEFLDDALTALDRQEDLR